MTLVDLWDALADERRSIADLLDGLTAEQWQVQTLCPAWDVRGMAAHLLVPCEFTKLEMVTGLLRARGNPDRLSLVMAAGRAELPTSELVARLREKAAVRAAPPVVGVMGPYTDALVHLHDMLIPLALTDERPAARWRPALDFLMSPKARIGFLPGAKPALRYQATDIGWQHGAGDVVSGPAAALGLAVLGRATHRLEELDGPGAGTLRTWAER